MERSMKRPNPQVARASISTLSKALLSNTVLIMPKKGKNVLEAFRGPRTATVTTATTAMVRVEAPRDQRAVFKLFRVW